MTAVEHSVASASLHAPWRSLCKFAKYAPGSVVIDVFAGPVFCWRYGGMRHYIYRVLDSCTDEQRRIGVLLLDHNLGCRKCVASCATLFAIVESTPVRIDAAQFEGWAAYDVPADPTLVYQSGFEVIHGLTRVRGHPLSHSNASPGEAHARVVDFTDRLIVDQTPIGFTARSFAQLARACSAVIAGGACVRAVYGMWQETDIVEFFIDDGWIEDIDSWFDEAEDAGHLMIMWRRRFFGAVGPQALHIDYRRSWAPRHGTAAAPIVRARFSGPVWSGRDCQMSMGHEPAWTLLQRMFKTWSASQWGTWADLQDIPAAGIALEVSTGTWHVGFSAFAQLSDQRVTLFGDRPARATLCSRAIDGFKISRYSGFWRLDLRGVGENGGAHSGEGRGLCLLSRAYFRCGVWIVQSGARARVQDGTGLPMSMFSADVDVSRTDAMELFFDDSDSE